jgi:hypothetical protein
LTDDELKVILKTEILDIVVPTSEYQGQRSVLIQPVMDAIRTGGHGVSSPTLHKVLASIGVIAMLKSRPWGQPA